MTKIIRGELVSARACYLRVHSTYLRYVGTVLYLPTSALQALLRACGVPEGSDDTCHLSLSRGSAWLKYERRLSLSARAGTHYLCTTTAVLAAFRQILFT